MTGGGLRSARTSETRGVILAVAERLYAEQGLHVVSNRHVSDAAGQGNNAAVAYHFGTKTDLVAAIIEKHSAAIEQLRSARVAKVAGSDSLRDWVACLIRPYTDHLATLGAPSWYGRFSVQVLADPVLRTIVYEHALQSESIETTRVGLQRCVPDLPRDVRQARSDMVRNLMMHVCAEKEREYADQHPERPPNWADCGSDLVDASVGLWQAPVTRR